MDVWYSGDYAVSFYEYGGELNPLGKFLGHTWKDWSLIPTARPFVVPPTHKTSEMDAKGINGKADVSNRLLGFPLFNNREGSWTFYVTDYNDYSDHIQDNNGNDILDYLGDPIRATLVQSFPEKYSQLLNLLQGKTVAIILDEDPLHFYKGTVQIEQWVASNDGSLNGLTIKYDLYPYKFKIEETVIDIDVRKTFSIDYPMMTVPYLYLEPNPDNPTMSNAKIWFDNEELNLHINPAGKSSSDWNFTGTLYEKVKMTARYGTNYPISIPTVVFSNMSGNNQMYFSTLNRNDKQFSKVQLFFREGRL